MRYALAALLRRPVFLAIALVSVISTVGIAAVVFVFMDALWFRPLPVSEPDRLVAIMRRDVASDGSRFSPAALEQLRHLGVFESVAGQVVTRGVGGDLMPAVRLGGHAQAVETVGVTPHYFQTLGLSVVGRDFSSGDNVAGAFPVAIISDRVWQQAFNRDPGVIGATVAATPLRLQIIGIAPPGFHGAVRGERTDVWLPAGQLPSVASGQSGADASGLMPMLAFARLPQGLSPTDAERAFVLAYGATGRPVNDIGLTPVSHLFGAADVPFVVIRDDGVIRMVAGVAVLLMAAGAATLMAVLLVYYERRRHELAVRTILGASRLDIVRLLAVESAWLVVAGTIGALLVAHVVLGLLPQFSLPGGVDLARLHLALDARVIAMTALVCTTIVAMSAALPVARMSQVQPGVGLATAGGSVGRQSITLRQTILAGHIALTVPMLLLAALFVQSALNGLTRGPGFDDERTLFLTVKTRSFRGWAADDVVRQGSLDAATSRVLMERLDAIPGVETVALGPAPLGSRTLYYADIPARMAAPQVVSVDSDVHDLYLTPHSVGPGYFDALGVPLLAGREPAHGEVVLSASLAANLSNEPPVGRWFRWNSIAAPVAGVVDVGFGTIRDGRPHVVFIADRDRNLASVLAGSATLDLTLRSHDPGAVRRRVEVEAALAFPEAVSIRLATGRELVAADLGQERLAAWFLSGISVTAWLLAVVAVFGLVGYVAETRRRDFGVMLALGASVTQVASQALATSTRPMAVGACVGLTVTFLLGRAAEWFLLGVSGSDLRTYAAGVTLFLLCTTAAGASAALRLRRLSPAEVMRD